jgi:hypothetical protein
MHRKTLPPLWGVTLPNIFESRLSLLFNRAAIAHRERENYRTMTSAGRTSISGTRTSTTGGPTMTAECSSYLPCPGRPPSSTRHPVVKRRVLIQTNNRIIFIFGLYRLLEDFTKWLGTFLWGITLHVSYAVAHSDLGSGGLIGVSAARMDFCTVRLERFPK